MLQGILLQTLIKQWYYKRLPTNKLEFNSSHFRIVDVVNVAGQTFDPFRMSFIFSTFYFQQMLISFKLYKVSKNNSIVTRQNEHYVHIQIYPDIYFLTLCTIITVFNNGYKNTSYGTNIKYITITLFFTKCINTANV